jgi:hypothetical protein
MLFISIEMIEVIFGLNKPLPTIKKPIPIYKNKGVSTPSKHDL